MSSDPTSPSRYRLLGTCVWLCVLLALKMVLVVGLVGFVPPAKRAFAENELEPPPLMQAVVPVSDVYAEHWSWLVPLVMLAIVAGVVLGRHAFRHRWPGTLFAAVCLLLLAAAVLLTANAVQVSYLKLEEGLLK
jgi:type II secretory pathway component PulF